MKTEPDFAKYTLDELIDARRSIDELLYSERVKKMEEQIAKKKPTDELKTDCFHALGNVKSQVFHYHNFLPSLSLSCCKLLG